MGRRRSPERGRPPHSPSAADDLQSLQAPVVRGQQRGRHPVLIGSVEVFPSGFFQQLQVAVGRRAVIPARHLQPSAARLQGGPPTAGAAASPQAQGGRLGQSPALRTADGVPASLPEQRPHRHSTASFLAWGAAEMQGGPSPFWCLSCCCCQLRFRYRWSNAADFLRAAQKLQQQ